MHSAELTAPAPQPPLVSARDRWARVCASAFFAVQGLSFASVISQVEPFRDKFGLDDTQLTVTLAAVPVVAGVGSVLAGMLAPKIGSGGVLRIAALGVATMTAVTGFVDQLAFFYVAVALFGLFLGAVDASMNMQGTAVQRQYGRSILASCHAWWSIAGITAALAAIWAADHLAQRQYLGGAAVLGVVISLVAGPGLLKKKRDLVPVRSGSTDAAGSTARRGWVVAFIGIALMTMFIGDAATTSWSGIFLSDALAATAAVVPSALFAYLVFQFVGRIGADRVIGRIGAVKTLLLAALVAAGGFVAVARAQQWQVALAGFALVGLGLSVVVPLTFSAADALDPAGTGTVIAKVNLFNYAGVIVGSVIIGVLAGSGDGAGRFDAGRLRLAFLVPAVLVLLIMVLAPAFRVVDKARARDIAAL